MIKAAICDDDIAVCSLLEDYLIRYGADNCLELGCDVFYSGHKLYETMKQGRFYHIIFLDIELKDGMNGIETGRCIRKKLNNYETQLVYITAYDDYAVKLFSNIVLGYVSKPFEYDMIKLIMDNFMSVVKLRQESFSFVMDRKQEVVALKDIRYFCIKGRRVEMQTIRDRCEFNGRLSEIYNQLQSNLFLYVSKSAIVNRCMVKNYFYNKVEMDDGTIIDISQKRRKDILKLVTEYGLRGSKRYGESK